MINSDNGTTLTTALVRQGAGVFHWPPLGVLLG